MRKAIIFLLIAGMVGCKSGDESPEELNPLVSLLNITALQGYGWTGVLTKHDCAAENVVVTTINCAIYGELEQETVANVGNNAVVAFQVTSPTAMGGQFTLILPNFNLNPVNTYYAVASSLTIEQGYDTGSGPTQTIRLPASLTTTANSTQLEILEFSAQQDPKNLPGTMKVRLSQPSNPSAGALVVTYGFNLSKLF